MSKKGENIYKRKDGRWEGRYIKSRTSTGKIVYGYIYAKTYRDVKNKLNEAKSAYHSETVKKTGYMCSDIALEWFENVKLYTKESTQNKYRNILTNHILPKYGTYTFDKITYESIDIYCKHLLISGGNNGYGLAPKTVSDILSIIRNILKYAIQKGIYVPCDANSIQIKQHSKIIRVLSKNEQNQLCNFIMSNIEPCNIGILICLFTGLRIGEICALRWEDISFTNQTIYVHQTLQRVQIQSANGNGARTKIIITEPKSSSSIRIIPIPNKLCKILMLYQKVSIGYLLTNSDSKFIEPRTMQNKFKRILKSVGIADANFHALRHTFATRCIEVGFDVKTLSEILGHATVNITMNRYVHPSLEMKQQHMQKLSNLLTVK